MGTQANQVTPERYLVRSPFLAWRVIDGQAVLISPQERELHCLNEVGTDIWSLADGSRTLTQIAQEMTRLYQVTPEEALQDVLTFAQVLLDKGVAFVCDHPTSEEELEQTEVS